MHTRTEGMLAVAAGVFVLVTAMLEPVVSAGIAAVLLAVAGVWKIAQSQR